MIFAAAKAAGAKSVISRIPRPVWYILAVLVIVGIIYWSGKRAGKRSVVRPPKDLPTGGNGIPVVGTDSSGNAIAWNPENIVDALKDSMWGWAWGGGTKTAALSALHPLSDDQFVAVWNRFNEKYWNSTEWRDSGYGNIRDWIEDETWDSPAGYDRVIQRMNDLQLYGEI
ncbi:MAG: hypothetical protein AAF570_04825 [Bacteroidota bacterium]